MPRKSRHNKDNISNNDEQWQQAWKSPGDMGMQKKQLLLNSINDRIDNRKKHKKQFFFIGLSAAAAILIAIFIKIPGNGSQINTNPWQELASTDSSKKIMLDDGSVVWLAPGSTVKVHTDFQKQRSTVLLKGTAFFSVAKDAQHPFTIDINRQQVTVVGTAFTIRKLDSVDLQLTVKEGKVSLKNTSGNRLLTAGQQVVTTNAITGTVHTIDPVSADWWLKQQVRLQNITLSELLNRIETYYQVKLTHNTVDDKKKVTLTWDLTISLHDNLTVLNTLTGFNIH
ncbi:FecR family protein [Niastella sp. OAS944]|uniref:FecR family protein n=1 Tax=Niastella sp. OAS944 TaxID=2664089 RepID=UPI00348D493A|nr:transmembrane sensor [Chitinophagaceae bacterium OAS944]